MPASPEDDFQQRAEITSILTPEEYEILRKLYLEKYTYEELAREMGLKKSALAMRVKRSKAVRQTVEPALKVFRRPCEQAGPKRSL